ncbi:hypothetical protein AB0M02_23515 [Actinoplanes sp. NPDC051861]|uniref:hypothetical protein n=1 Tax=Actinoplanes sp. NPDC051861 TaxID=3155170 RepID=UPI00343C582E
MSLAAARAVADAVLYEGYLLYPYRASAAKNRTRWQFGVLGPPSAAGTAFGEAPDMSMQCLLAPGAGVPTVTVRLRFLQVQAREVRATRPDGTEERVTELVVGETSVLTWDEAVEREVVLPDVPLDGEVRFAVSVPGGQDEEPVGDAGRIVRRRWPLSADVRVTVSPDGEHRRLTVAVTNTHPGPAEDRSQALRHSLLSAHLLLEARNAAFLSVIDPPPEAVGAAARCSQNRCWPVLAGGHDLLLGAPIILYDHPRIAEQSRGDLFDSTEIDEILTLRVMTMTDQEKAEARATDARAAAIIDRCDAATPADLQRLHGTCHVDKGSLVRIRPNRRADAQDLFFAGRIARVAAVVEDVDGGTHVAVTLLDDPAADLHDWYGRYLYFAPDELVPVAPEEEP